MCNEYQPESLGNKFQSHIGFEVQGPGICDAQATRTTTLRNLSIKQENGDFTTINGDLMVNNGE